ncbi:MAG: PVC-type heme-binding CxxCH protein, partial [Verrucomicrobiota bacterium]
EAGRQVAGRYIAEQLTGTSVADADRLAKVADQVAEKNWHWFNRYRATDGNDVWGGRSKLKFVNDQTNAEVLQHELVMFDAKTANRDEGVWAAARGEEVKPVDDSNVPPPVPVISNVGGGSKSSNASKEGSLTYVSGQEGIEKMTLAEGYKVNLFADEAMFPEMVNPVQMQVDTQGRLWAAVWPTYPKWEPLKEMKDALVILEDTDNDGVADVCKEFARVHNPLGFEFWNGGVLVTSQPDLIFLKDTDGDDVADVRQVLLHGFGSADTHHTANNLIYGPSGGIYWQSGIFLQHNHEHPWGAPITTTASGMFRWDPRRYTIAFHAENRPNPHGISFDQWGYHYANDGTGGRSYQVRPSEKGFAMHSLLTKEVRPVSADEIVSSTHFPDEIQGNFLVCNTIGYLGLKNYKLHRDGFTRQETQKAKKGQEPVVKTMEHAVGEVWGTPDEELLQSTDGNFRPTDAIFGEDGALYISDWSNVIIGHMQHNIRDPNRDKKHGRIYRMTYPSRALQEPVAIDGEPLAALMKNLEHPVNGVRHRTRVELSERDSDEVIAAAQAWLATLDPQNSDQARHFLEALWVHQQHNVRDRELLKTVMNSPVEHVRINAATVKHHWDVADPAQGALEIVEQEEVLSSEYIVATKQFGHRLRVTAGVGWGRLGS